MLKTVSSITNAIGALNYKGTWNASTNTPTITSSVGVKGDYYVVSVSGTTTIDGISNWGVGDWITFNGSVWQRVEGGADLNGVNLSVSGTTTLSGLTASTALALNASKEVVSVTNTGTGDNVLATTPTLVGDVTLSTGNLVVSDTKGIDFSATPGTGTSELFDDYEEGTWTPTVSGSTGDPTLTYATQFGYYTKVGRLVTVHFALQPNVVSVAGSGNLQFKGLPFTSANLTDMVASGVSPFNGNLNWGTNKTALVFSVGPNATIVGVFAQENATAEAGVPVGNFNTNLRYLYVTITYTAT